MGKTVLMAIFAALLVSACTATGVGPHWERPGGKSFTPGQLEADQDACRREAAQQVAREMAERRPGPESFERKRALIFSCMEEKGWVWQEDQPREPVRPRRSYY